MLVQETNKLFPIFLKLEQLSILIVGGGNVGLEKLTAVLNNSPLTKIKLVATSINESIKALAAEYPTIELFERPFESTDVDGADIVIIGINDKTKSAEISEVAKGKNKLVNVADTPDLCDFYLSSVVQKGNVKIAISTNGKSPTVAKRLKEVLNEAIPAEINNVADNLSIIRNNINGDFSEKVRQLNDLTRVLVSKQMTLEEQNKPGQKRWQKIVKYCLFAFFFMIIGHTILSYVPVQRLVDSIKTIPNYIDTKMFLMMLLCGFLAQMSDGSLGMGYGTISTTFLLAVGVNPAIVSSRVHAARVFSSGVSGYSHHRFGNINKKLFKALVIPGIVGAVLGATMAYFGQKYATYVRLPLSVYTIYLGYYILRKAFSKPSYEAKVKRAGWLAAVGGFMDAFAGGGWGTLVTSTLMSKRRSPRYVIGSVCLAEFFVVFMSSVVFFILLESLPLWDIAGLIIGGLIAAPIAARLVGKLPIKTMFILVGTLVILTSCNTLWKAIMNLIA
ncbi:TSUP family transporter [Flavisolibacter nicotianae]|uniref:TSUP family transporter n=1 Tax=Flavisolibacter nicotianae TaxID=2364882 RepID=UPI000EB03E85|nr:TSUP family transporter [Flavisolibacter nicotianae]